jgi:GDP-4-dehydro-6-deoxy-D-mannose reductase
MAEQGRAMTLPSARRILITGAAGFVGPHAVAALGRHCPGAELLLTSLHAREDVAALDVTNRAACLDFVGAFGPTDVLNLAGFAAPGLASKNPDLTWAIHLDGVRNLGEAILRKAPECRLIQVGTGLVYGKLADRGLADEATLVAPLDDYAASKAAADLALGVLARKGLKCLRLRPFNHSGPGQSEDFVIPAFAMQIARIEAGLMPPLVRVGNLDAERDILDVSDVAEAYARAVAADWRENGEIFNIASGAGVRIQALLDGLLALSGLDIKVEPDPARARPSDVPFIAGNARKFREAFGWKPQLSLDEVLARVLDDCRARVARGEKRV